MLGDDRFRKVAARVVVDDRNVEGTYASDSVTAVAQSAIAALVLFLVLIMAFGYSFDCLPVSQYDTSSREGGLGSQVSASQRVARFCGQADVMCQSQSKRDGRWQDVFSNRDRSSESI